MKLARSLKAAHSPTEPELGLENAAAGPEGS